MGWSADAPPDPAFVKHVAAVLSGTSVGLAALLGYWLGGRGVMILAALLGIFHFGHLVQAAAPNSEPAYGLLMVLVLLAAGSPRVHPGLVGALAGFTALVRAEFLLGALLLAVWMAVDQPVDSRSRRAAWFLAGLLIALLPTTVLNWRSIDAFNRQHVERMPGPLPRFAPVTSYGAFTFANANHGEADGGFNWSLPALAPSDEETARGLEAGQLDLARPPVYRAYIDGYGMGLRWLVSNPVPAIELLGRKLAITLSVFDYGYLLDNVPVTIRGLRRPVDQLDLETSWLSAAHLLLVLGGLWRAVRTPATRVLLPPLLTLLASSLLFFGYVRLGVAYLPVLWVLQALAGARLLAALPVAPRWARRAELAAAALVLLLLVAERSRVGELRVLEIDGLVDEDGRLVEDQPMRLERVR